MFLAKLCSPGNDCYPPIKLENLFYHDQTANSNIINKNEKFSNVFNKVRKLNG